MEDDSLIPKHGGYGKLKSFQLAQVVHDLTVRFVDRYVERHSRTRDQMVQAARSGVQNIVEGSQVSGTSRKMEMKLTNVARASLEELRTDYEDYLRQHGLAEWDRRNALRQELIERRCATSKEVAQWVGEVHERGRSGPSGLKTPDEGRTQPTAPTYPEIAANALLTLITVTCYLLDRQIAAQAKTFEAEGGFTERLHRTRIHRRGPKP